MEANKKLFILVIIIFAASALNTLTLLLQVNSITAKATETGKAEICMADLIPTTVFTDCLSIWYEDENISCTFFTNKIGTEFYYHNSSSDINHTLNTNLFNISTSGMIFSEINYSDIGNYTYPLKVMEVSGCRYDEYNYTFQIIPLDNYPPELIEDIDDYTWVDGTTLIAFDLDDHFYDRDNDPLTYNYTYVPSSIKITISPNHIVSLTSTNFRGKVPVQFIAKDPSNATAYSNVVWLEVLSKVVDIEEEEEETETPKSSGMGGSVGSMMSCFPIWQCGNWSECQPHGYQLRECYDTLNCSSSLFKPNLTQACEYTPVCNDGIQNGDETGVDCGGSCLNACVIPHCSDGIRNKGEEGVDCGGECENKCEATTCFNGVQDGDEEGVDCGGSCKKCPVLEAASETGTSLKDLLKNLIIPLITVGIITAAYETYKHKKIIKKAFKHMKPRGALTKKQATDFMEELNKLEINMPNLTTANAATRLSNIIKLYLKAIFNFDALTNEEIKGLISNSDIEIKELIGDFFNTLNSIQYTNQDMPKNKIISMIYEAKLMISMTTENKDYQAVNQIIENNEYSNEIIAYQNILKKDVSEAKKIYLNMYSEAQQNKIPLYPLKMLYGFINQYEKKNK